MDLSKFHIAFNDFTVSNTVFHGGCGASVDAGMIFHERRLCEGQSHNSMFCVGGVLDDVATSERDSDFDARSRCPEQAALIPAYLTDTCRVISTR